MNTTTVRKGAHLLLNAIMGKLILKVAVIFVAALAAAVPFCFKSAYPDELVVEFTMGNPTNMSVSPGPHWVWPLLQKWERYDARTQYLKLDEREAANKNDVPGVGAITKDKVPVGVVVEIHYKIDKSKGAALTEAFGYQESEEMLSRIQNRVATEVRSAVRTLIPFYTMEQMLEYRGTIVHNSRWLLGTRAELQFKAVEGVDLKREALLEQTSLSDIGLIVDHFSMAFEPDLEYREAKRNEKEEEYRKHQSLESQKRIAEEQKEKTAQAELDRIEAEAQANRISTLGRADQFTPVKSLFFETWDGRLPTVMVIDSNSDLLQFLVPLIQESIKDQANIEKNRDE